MSTLETASKRYQPEQPDDLQAIWLKALSHAVRAPSGHNTQPWLFHLPGNALELYADRRRSLPVVDPGDRALVISCGACLHHLVLSLRHFGFATQVELLPDANKPDLLARVEIAGECAPDAGAAALFAAIPQRRTNRFPFQQVKVDSSLLAELINDAHCEQAWLHPIHQPAAREATAALVDQGDHIQAADPQFRRELAMWVHPNRSWSRDGMPGYAHGFGDVASCFGRLVIRTFDFGDGQAAKDKELIEGSPLLVVLGTNEDSRLAWLQVGQALSRVLLRATAAGLSASFLNQPIEVPQLRPRLAQVLGREGVPQLLIRMGYGKEVRATPRRKLEDVICS